MKQNHSISFSFPQSTALNCEASGVLQRKDDKTFDDLDVTCQQFAIRLLPEAAAVSNIQYTTYNKSLIKYLIASYSDQKGNYVSLNVKKVSSPK